MNKAIIFDFDGVLINSEQHREQQKYILFQQLFGEEIGKQLGVTTGMNIDTIYQKSIDLGSTISKDYFIQQLFAQAPFVYSQAELAPGIDTIGAKLTGLGYKLGIVSASLLEWIEIGLSRTTLGSYISRIISLQDRKDLAHKPSPDGYIEMMHQLEVPSSSTFILEDSETGIKSARKSGAHVIYFSEFTQNIKEIEDFDSKIHSLNEITKLLS